MFQIENQGVSSSLKITMNLSQYIYIYLSKKRSLSKLNDTFEMENINDYIEKIILKYLCFKRNSWLTLFWNFKYHRKESTSLDELIETEKVLLDLRKKNEFFHNKPIEVM